MAGTLDANSEWKEWMCAFGGQVRRVREFLGLSQEQVARLAGVSQGAVSRLEAGRGLATPLVVVLKINLAVSGALAQLDPALLNDEMRRTMEFQRSISPPRGQAAKQIPVTSDPNIDALVRLYRGLPERQRRTFVSVMQATAAALASGGASVATTGGGQKQV